MVNPANRIDEVTHARFERAALFARAGQGGGSGYVLLLGALKHVTAYSLENWVDDTGGPNNGTRYNRMGFDATISRHDLAETYLEQYRVAITESEPLGMMCARREPFDLTPMAVNSISSGSPRVRPM